MRLATLSRSCADCGSLTRAYFTVIATVLDSHSQ